MKRGIRQYMAIRLEKILILALGIFFSISGMAQLPKEESAISPVLLKEIREGKIKGKTTFRVTVLGPNIPKEINKPALRPAIILAGNSFTVFQISGTINELFELVNQSENVVFIERGSRVPREELLQERLDLSVNKINLVHRYYPGWNGEGKVVSVKENKPDTTDIDLQGRYITTHLSSAIYSSHANIMSTMIAGGGNTWHLGKGAAWGSSISSSDFSSLLPDPDEAYRRYNLTVQNHSYGVGVESYYGSDASLYDLSAMNNKKLLHVFSSGNSGSSASSTGIYAGLTGYANLTGSFKMAKNILTVGATDSFGLAETLSSRGPAHDGRVKPELVAFGEDGSSGAAALVSGSALVLQQAYEQLHDSMPSNALLRSVLLNSADDAGNPEVDFTYGFGRLNALNAMKTLQLERHFSGSAVQGSVMEFTITIPAGIQKFKATLTWNDLPAPPNAIKALMNDLDLELVDALSGNTWKPWVLNNYPHADSLHKPAERKTDRLNTVEQVTLDNPPEGIYRLRVTGFDITDAQDFHLAYQLDSAGLFVWEYPTKTDYIRSGESNAIRWNSSMSDSVGTLDYSTDGGASWENINNNLNLTEGYYRWDVPFLLHKALLRMTIGASQFISDAFTISSRTLTGVGFNCPDSLLLYWTKLNGVEKYRVLQLADRYLDTITVTADSLIILSKNVHPAIHYAVAPLIGDMEGLRSYTFNYTTQGVDCYIRSLLGSLENNKAQLDLSLGTLYGIASIVFEKYNGSAYEILQTIDHPASMQLRFTDDRLNKGLNVYRVKIVLTGGGFIYSQPETIYYFMQSRFIIFPNPVRRGQPLEILTSDDIISNITLLVYDSYGRKLKQLTLKNSIEQISTNSFSGGMYYFRFIVEGEKDTILKVLIQ